MTDDASVRLIALLSEAGKRGFTWHEFHDAETDLDLLAGVLRHPGAVDVFVLENERSAHGYRAPVGDGVDVFHPDQVWKWYGRDPVAVLEALLNLAAPGEPKAPVHLIDLPAPTGIPEGMREVRVRVSRWTVSHGRPGRALP